MGGVHLNGLFELLDCLWCNSLGQMQTNGVLGGSDIRRRIRWRQPHALRWYQLWITQPIGQPRQTASKHRLNNAHANELVPSG
jgi:hypothetical protein